MIMSLRKIVTLSLLVLILIHAPATLACGPFTLSAVFSFTVHPEYPLENYARGEIGVVRPTYARSYLYAAYRHLAGVGLSGDEQAAIVKLWRERLEYRFQAEESLTEGWAEARKKVPNVGEMAEIDFFRSREKPNEYEQYLNCANDAFETATKTLNSRIERFGAESPQIKDWVAAQDQVFANCSAGTHIPDPAPANADPLIQRDRTYQIAAANFYAGNYSEAAKLFSAIARDKESPWQSSASYLLARTFTREASLGPAERRDAAHAAAEKELNTILKNSSLPEWHAPAKRLLNLVLLRYRPEARLNQLATALLAKNNDNLKQDLWDYTVLLDQFLGEDWTEKKETPDVIRKDDLSDWIATFQQETAPATQHAYERWQAGHSLPWLVAALAKAPPGGDQANALLAAAAGVSTDSPGFATVSFHAVRLMMAANQFKEARAKLDDLLVKHAKLFTLSGANQLKSLRLLVATDLRDFLKHAQRLPAAFAWDDDGREIPADDSDQSAETKALRGKMLFDADASQLLNRDFPLELWRDAAASDVLPSHLRRDLTQAAFLRAVLLGNARTAESLVPTLKTQMPELTKFLDDYLATSQPGARKFSAIYMWLKFPGLEPIVDTGMGRQIGPAEQDSYRDNWWCTAAFTPTPEAQQNEPARPKPTFLSAQEQAVGKAEAAKLQALGAAPNLLAREVIQWANRTPGDPRVPEALHLAVKSTRFGCTDKDTVRWSKAAFDLLHKRYPRSVWTKRTPYWFKD